MSWDAHVSAAVGAQAKSAVICGKDGTPWGKHGQFNPCNSELSAMYCCVLNGKSDGIKLEGNKYMCINGAEGVMGYRHGNVSAAAYAVNSHGGVVIGAEGARVPDCVELAIKLKNYMIEHGQT